MYIGQSINIERRWAEHINSPMEYMFIDRAIKKHGAKKFDFKIIESFDEDMPFLKDVLNDSEKFFIQSFNTYGNPKHYNLTQGGDGTHLPNHTLKSMKKISKYKTNTGLFRVTKYPRKNIKQGFEYRYQYYIDKKRYAICSIHLKDLESKVKKAKQPWMIIDKEKANKTFKIEKNKKKYIDYRNGKTGIFRVYINKDKSCKQGFKYFYSYHDKFHKPKGITSVNLRDLEKKVKKQGLLWKVVDKKKAQYFYDYEDDKNE